LERLARDDAVTGRPRSGGDQDAARWREALQRQLDDARLDAQPWALLAALDPVWLAETLRRRGHRSAWRRTFARNLGPADIRRILALWAPPAEADVFTVLAERAGEWLPKLGEGTRDPTATVRLWLLDYLLVARRRAFESEAVFADLVERAAETSGLSFPQIFARLHATRPPLGRDAPEALERLEAAALALAGKATSSIITDPGDLGAPAARSRREMLRGALRAALEDGARPGMGSAPWREALADDKAWLIAELWRQGRRREIRNALVHELPPDFLLDLAAAATAAEARLLLTKAAPGPEARAEVLRNFWTTVLDALWGESSTPREALARALWAWARRQENLTRARAFRALRQYANRGRNDTAADAEDGASPVEARWRDLLRRQRRPEAEPAIRAISLLSGALAASGANPLVFEHRERLLAEFNTRVVLGEFFREGRRFDPTGFAIGWFNALIAETGTADPAPWREAIAAALESGVSGGGEADRLVLAKALRTGDAQTSPQVATVPARRMTTTPVAEDVDYVANAGMVLAGPYLPMLFGRLGLLHEGVFAEGAAQRAVHLLQFLVDGGPPRLEHELVLNKLLCGLDLDEPIEATFDITPDELETIEGLLRAMIQRWTALGSTSIAGLRETFLQRRGALSLKPELWRLRVEPRAFDVLLDRIPWGFTTLKPPWMKQVLHVDWR
ncbi:MAG: contractile injection system tape measure protein, partial [Caulobacteraceae bacterium]